MKRKKKKFSWPRKLYDKPRIIDENKLAERYGLKNKREIWKMEAKTKYFRNRAKNLITASQEEQQKFFYKLNKIGLRVETIADVLALNKENLLKRRLSSVVVAKNLANSPKQARQMIVHKKILVGDRLINIPGYLVRTDEEGLISVKTVARKKPIESVEIKTKENPEAQINEQ